MECLQVELMMEILSRVPTLDLLKLSSVCRRWTNILNDPLFRRLHCTRSKSNPSENNHVLVLKLKGSSELHWVDLADKPSPRIRHVAVSGLPDVPNFTHFRLIGSCNGLVCLGSDVSMQIYVLNPFTRQHLLFDMPTECKRAGDLWSWGFGFDEITKLFKVVLILQIEVIVCDLGAADSINWRCIGKTTFYTSIGLLNSFNTCPSVWYSSSFVNGRLHWIYFIDGPFCGIISFDLADEKFRPIPTPDCLSLHVGVVYNLIVWRGCLCIHYNHGFESPNLQIWVMRKYGVKESWVKEWDTYPLIPRSFDHLHLRGLGFGKDGELVVSDSDHRGTRQQAILFSSDLTCDEFKHLQLAKPPCIHGSIIHASSLNWI